MVVASVVFLVNVVTLGNWSRAEGRLYAVQLHYYMAFDNRTISVLSDAFSSSSWPLVFSAL